MRIDAPRVKKLTFQAGAAATESAFTGSFTGSFEGTGTFPGLEVEFDNIQNTPTLVSGSGQIDGSNITNNSISFTNGAGLASIADGTLGGSTTIAVDGVLQDLDTLGAAASDGQFIVATGAGTFGYESGATARGSLGIGTIATAASGDYLAVSNNLSDIDNAGTARTNLGVDAAGTDNSTDVTLVTTSHDYLSLSGQAITLGQIDISDDTNLSVSDTTGQTGINLTLSGDALSGTLVGLGTSATPTFGALTVTNDVTINGNLSVVGTKTELQVATLNVEDTNILIASGAADSAAANGAGLTIDGANESLTWDHGNTRFNFSDDLNVAGNITLSGTVDGRDIATDGSKLDNIEASADVTDTTNVVAALTAGTNVSIAADGTISSTDTNTQNTRATLSIDTDDDVQFDSLGIGTAASGTTGEIRATGDITAFYSSDERLKENITELNGVFNKLLQVGTYNYDWKDGISEITSKTGNDIGVIAQEVREIFPELVEERDNGYLAVDYLKFTTLLITANREIGARLTHMKSNLQYCTKTIEDLKEEIEKLKNA